MTSWPRPFFFDDERQDKETLSTTNNGDVGCSSNFCRQVIRGFTRNDLSDLCL